MERLECFLKITYGFLIDYETSNKEVIVAEGFYFGEHFFFTKEPLLEWLNDKSLSRDEYNDEDKACLKLDGYLFEEDFPVLIQRCKKTYGTISASFFAELLFDSLEFVAIQKNVQEICDQFIENIYSDCDMDDDDYANLPKLKRTDVLELPMRLFSINLLLYKYVQRYPLLRKYFDPAKHSIGLWFLQLAFDRFVKLNQNHYVYIPCKEFIEIKWSEVQNINY